MAGPFDGMSGIINATLGGVVTIFPGGGVGQEVQAIFRERPIETGDTFGEGGFWTSLPSLKIRKPDAEGLAPRDRVEADGRAWRVLSVTPLGSPAQDGFLMVELETFPAA